MRNRKPGDIVAYRRRPRNGELLAHNRVVHTRNMQHGVNGFRWFVVNGQPGHGWKKCPCGWRPDLGIHYADPSHVEWWQELHEKLGNQEAIDRYIWKRVSADWPPFLRKLRVRR